MTSQLEDSQLWFNLFKKSHQFSRSATSINRETIVLPGEKLEHLKNLDLWSMHLIVPRFLHVFGDWVLQVPYLSLPGAIMVEDQRHTTSNHSDNGICDGIYDGNMKSWWRIFLRVKWRLTLPILQWTQEERSHWQKRKKKRKKMGSSSWTSHTTKPKEHCPGSDISSLLKNSSNPTQPFKPTVRQFSAFKCLVSSKIF